MGGSNDRLHREGIGREVVSACATANWHWNWMGKRFCQPRLSCPSYDHLHRLALHAVAVGRNDELDAYWRESARLLRFGRHSMTLREFECKHCGHMVVVNPRLPADYTPTVCTSCWEAFERPKVDRIGKEVEL